MSAGTNVGVLISGGVGLEVDVGNGVSLGGKGVVVGLGVDVRIDVGVIVAVPVSDVAGVEVSNSLGLHPANMRIQSKTKTCHPDVSNLQKQVIFSCPFVFVPTIRVRSAVEGFAMFDHRRWS